MALLMLENTLLRLLVAEQGGTIEGLWLKQGEGDIPLLRPGKRSGVAVESSCFPLVPFGNRVSGNSFTLAGKSYVFQPNVPWDSHYLHGDGWLNLWQCIVSAPDKLVLEYVHRQGVYRYTAQQAFSLQEDCVVVELSVTNNGTETLPFGLGWHPYFPLSATTRVQAKADGYWLEKENWLAGDYQSSLPAGLDFNAPAALPRKWVNNGFAGWNGEATIAQPQLGYTLMMSTQPPAPYYFVFVSDPAFDKGYEFDFFCLEPMSHAPDDHHRQHSGDLTLLAPEQKLRQSMLLQLKCG